MKPSGYDGVAAIKEQAQFSCVTGLVERDVHFGVAAGSGGLNAGGDALKMHSYACPLGCSSQDNHGNLPAS